MQTTKHRRNREVRFEGQERSMLRFFKRRDFEFGSVVSHSIYDQRMTGVEKLPDITATGRRVDAPDPHHRARMNRLESMTMQERGLEEPLWDKKKGLRLDVLLLAMAVLGLTLGTAWLIDRAAMNQVGKNIAFMTKEIERTSAVIVDLEQEYNDALANIDVVRYAIEKLDMISTKGSNRISLEVPADALLGALEAPGSATAPQMATIAGD